MSNELVKAMAVTNELMSITKEIDDLRPDMVAIKNELSATKLSELSAVERYEIVRKLGRSEAISDVLDICISHMNSGIDVLTQEKAKLEKVMENA